MIDPRAAKIAEATGLEDRLCMLMEESGELIQAANKMRRELREISQFEHVDRNVDQKLSGLTVMHLIEEMADVECVMDEILYLLNEPDKSKDVIKNRKLIRTCQILENREV